ncbi:hypothetical protein [Chondromyces apiculatus]|uniref:Putative cell-wall-anchored protein SasA (LPXTG motif) n=1 Tax=Chondromyces apiculatus DSM 436 TaxID=1192034 RepID=A0A017THW6_9BACT|nr:hypothetical protein [Chondromyces apiculatus]EYF08873.1 putative cell-wall-anchored protein SasA (LPXTG motif) [Chondromyces apiculatus DSM 436]
MSGGGNDDVKVQGKYLLLEVPDFDPNDPEDNRTSYIRLGKTNTNWQNEGGATLALMSYLAGAAGREGLEALSAKHPNGQSFDVVELFESKSGTDEAVKAIAEAIDGPIEEVNLPFIDDNRRRGTGNVSPVGPPGHGLDPAGRAAVSADLHARCGWRDHCDGNRITTTYGDKVEVVWGNYKMIVMGRQWDPGQAMGWEASGNNVQDYAGATMPGASVTVEWIATAYNPAASDVFKPGEEFPGGAWLLQNSTENVWQYSRNAGNFKEENWGDLWETYVGSENPTRISTKLTDGTEGHPTEHTTPKLPPGANWKKETNVPMPVVPGVGLPRGNPHIIEKTWAIKMEAYTGSKKWRIPEMHEETWAETTSEVVDVSGDTSSETTVGGTIKERTSAEAMDSHTNVSGGVAEMTNIGGAISTLTNVGGAMAEVTNVGATMVSATHAGTIFEETVTAAHVEFHGALAHASIEIGAVFDLFLGAKLEIDISAAYEVTIGPHKKYLTAEEKTALASLKRTATKHEQSLMSTERALNKSLWALQVLIGV